MDIDAGTRALDEGRSEGLGQRLVIDLPLLKGADQCPVDDETRRQLRELGLPDIIIDRWTQSQADLHLQFSNGSPFDQHLVAQELAEIEEKRRIEEMVRLLLVKDEPPLSDVFERTQAAPPAPVVEQEVEEVMPPDYDPPSPAPAAPLAPADIAYSFANAGWPVFPCDPRTKHPLTPRDRDPKTGKPINGTGGFKKATTDLETNRRRWGKYPNAMIGIPTGEVISAFVLEIDISDKATGVIYTTVEAQIAAVEAELGVALPSTMRVISPRSGAHLYYRSAYGYPRNDTDIKRAGKELRGVDVRGDGGYVIAAGSIRHDGKAYERVGSDDIANAPVELVAAVAGVHPTAWPGRTMPRR
jgi:hypothetical protein